MGAHWSDLPTAADVRAFDCYEWRQWNSTGGAFFVRHLACSFEVIEIYDARFHGLPGKAVVDTTTGDLVEGNAEIWETARPSVIFFYLDLLKEHKTNTCRRCIIRQQKEKAAQIERRCAICKTGIDAEAKGDFELAVRSYEEASAAGDDVASNNLGLLYEHGTGVVAHPARAFALFEDAAQAGNADGMYNYGRCYKGGLNGAPKDEGCANVWFRKAAALGHAAAQSELEGARPRTTTTSEP